MFDNTAGQVALSPLSTSCARTRCKASGVLLRNETIAFCDKVAK